MPKPYPQEFRDDVVKVALDHPDGVTLKEVAAAPFGSSDAVRAMNGAKARQPEMVPPYSMFRTR